MHIVLFHFYSNPNPDYRNLAVGLRARGHTVWLGERDQNGDLTWHDGERIIALQKGPAALPKILRRVRLVTAVWRRVAFFHFMLRVRRLVQRARPDIIQVNPSVFVPWVLSVLMPEESRAILDVRQLNVGIRKDLVGRIKEWRLVMLRWLYARYLFDHTCFNHAGTARKVLGANWQASATVIPVGLHPFFLSQKTTDPSAKDSDDPVRFIYIGTLTRFRQLEQLVLASQRMLSETDRFRIVFIGPDETQGYLQEQINELNLNGVVSIMPPVPNDAAPALLADYDVGLAYVPNRATWHYQPTIKVRESLALGLPILSTDVLSHREVVKEGVNGLLVSNTVENLAEGMLQFVRDRAFLHRCWINAQTMRRGMTLDKVAEMYEQDVYLPLRDAKEL